MAVKLWQKIGLTDPETGQSVTVSRIEIFGFVLMSRRLSPNESGGQDRDILITSRFEKEGE